MASVRDIKRRIRSIKNTQQITKAMEMVAAAKLRRVQDSVGQARPFKEKIKEVLSRIVASGADLKEPLLEVRTPKKIGYVVISAERGLAGGYNANIIKKAVVSMAKHRDLEIGVIPVGKKGRDFFRRRGYPIEAEFINLQDVPTIEEANKIADFIRNSYTEGVFDEVYLVYTEFITTIQHKPVVSRILPIETPSEEETGEELDYIFEPSPELVLNKILPLYLANQVFSALTEAKASEHGARMTAMGSATDNAAEIIDQLTLSYNRARQDAITREITEIVSGANALKQ